MKRAIAIFVVLACILLMPNISAKMQINCSVQPEAADYQRGFTYNIHLTNSANTELGTVSLIVGPDYNNRDISKRWDITEVDEPSCEIKGGNMTVMPANGFCTVTKRNVTFTDEELYRGEFRAWAEAPESLVKWNKTWYKCCFKPFPSGEEICSEEKRGPILTNITELFRNDHTALNKTYKGLSFDYSIDVWANKEDSIVLQVKNINTTEFVHKEARNYTEPRSWQTLTWTGVNLTLDYLGTEFEGQYGFIGTYNESKIYFGPTIEEEFYLPSVYYNKTISNLSFDYEVTTWVNMVEDNTISLEVWNFSAKSWEPKGIRSYTKPGYNQTLRWAGINLSYVDHFDDHLRGKYRFTGTYGESSPADKGHQGPIIEENYYNSDVTPKEGTNIDTFYYSVTVNANVCDKIELQVKNHTTNHWDTKGTREYRTPDINETLTWQEIRLNTHELDRFNDSAYKFVGTFESSESKGPFYPIELRWRTHNVTPNRGLYNHPFNYSIEVNSTRAIEVKLRVDYPHEGEAVISDPMKNYTDRGNWEPLCWMDRQPFVDADDGNATYKFEFYYEGTRINETELYPGPLIGIAEFKDASFEPEIGTGETEFTYRVRVKAVKPDYITLTVYDSKGDKVAERRSKDKTTAEWKLFEFENVPFKVPPASGIATYEFLTGKDTKMSFDGPELIEEEFGELSVSPKEGTNNNVFNFSVDYKTSNPDYVTLWAKCDDGEWVEVERKQVVSEQGTIIFQAKTPCETFETVCWKCTGIVSESEINCTNWDIGLKWQSRSFSPEEGWWDDTFDFSVSLSANVPGEVELMVKEDDTNEWVAAEKKSYTGSPNPQTLTWENERIFSTYEGNTSYNFIFYWGKIGYASLPYPGPKLFIPLNISISSADVIPDASVSYIENEMLQDYFMNRNSSVTFSSSVSATKDTSIKLVTIDPFGAETEYDAKEYHGPGLKALKWAVESSNFERIGVWAYKFMYKDARYGWANYSEEFKGPEIIAVLRDFDIEPEPPLLYGESCDVTVVVNGSRDLTITLELCNLTSHCKPVQNGTKLYKSSEGEREMVWKDIKPFGETYGSTDKLLFQLDVT